MKKFNNKSVLERGGLMIEALAMLGLIAVVTPTMYKKSAERTMEVEDINTATSMRTIMGAAESYMSSNYNDIMKVMEEDTSHQHTISGRKIGVMDIPMADLTHYLPYKFNEEGELYNYKSPKIRIVRAGDNLTAFALFPAKVDGEHGIGQERTVRIASLIGANGGYISSKENEAKQARGVGGVWNLDGDYYSAVFNGVETDNQNQYSLVTSSSNVVNGANAMAESDPTQFVQRTKQEGSGWRNAMRTDLYMGSGPDSAQDPDDREHQDDFFSIYNVNEMIIGADRDAKQELLKAVRNEPETAFSADPSSYGLYVAGSGSRGEGAGNAYIKGTLIAAGNRLWAGNETLKYTGTNLEFDGTNFKIGKNQTDASKDADNYVMSGHAEKGKSTLDIMGDKINVAEAGDIGNYKPKNDVQKKANVVVHTTNKDTHTTGTVNPPAYSADSKAPDFGVDIDGNMVVEGVLAAGQLDVNNIRTANISVGSENIDDEYKWMDVDKNGVHVHQPASGAYKGTQIEARDKLITMRVGSDNAIDKNTDSNGVEADNAAQIIMDGADAANGSIIQKVKGTNGKIALANDNLGINIKNRAITIGNTDAAGTTKDDATQYFVGFGKGGNIHMTNSNLKISDANNNALFTVRGLEDSKEDQGIVDNTTRNSSPYNIAAHGNILFTDGLNNGNSRARYLAMSNNGDGFAAVNIIKGDADGTINTAGTGVVYIDMDTGSESASMQAVSGTDYQIKDAGGTVRRNVQGGSIYIRKGLIDVVPDKNNIGQVAKTRNNTTGELTGVTVTGGNDTADQGRGVIRASRFVANNITTEGNPVKVPAFFTQAKLEEYSGSGTNRYDTYMVNPAYTSVMNDIKLVSRGGARLSDILPTFITKGIYTAKNNYSELAFHGDTSGSGSSGHGVSLEPSNLFLKADGTLNIYQPRTGYTSDPASPIIGVVPAPQCPPGYARMITVTPASIRMAEAGRFRNPSPSSFNGYKIDVDSFTDPTNQDYITYEGKNYDLDDLNNMRDENGNVVSLPDSVKQNMGQSVQLYNTYINSESAGIRDMRRANPSYKTGVHMTGGEECFNWGADGECLDSNHYGYKMEMHVAEAGDIDKNRNENKVHDSHDSTMGQTNVINVPASSSSVWSSYKEDGYGDKGGTVYHSGNTNASGKYKANIVKDKVTLSIMDRDEDGNVLWTDHAVTNEIDMSDTRLLVDRIKNVSFEDRDGAPTYVLTSGNADAFAPITFQKSTWLKTAAIPVAKTTVSDTQRQSAYASGWAILMGFLYPQHGYRNVLNTLGFDVANSYQTYPMYEDDGENYIGGFNSRKAKERNFRVSPSSPKDDYFFWNIFPVEQESLEAFITTYCYFDQDNKAFKQFNSSEEVKDHLPMIDYITTFPSGYEPEGHNKNYRKLLNDPSMKYNELW